MIVIEKAEHPV